MEKKEEEIFKFNIYPDEPNPEILDIRCYVEWDFGHYIICLWTVYQGLRKGVRYGISDNEYILLKTKCEAIDAVEVITLQLLRQLLVNVYPLCEVDEINKIIECNGLEVTAIEEIIRGNLNL